MEDQKQGCQTRNWSAKNCASETVLLGASGSDEGNEFAVGIQQSFVVVDAVEQILEAVRKYDLVIDSVGIVIDSVGIQQSFVVVDEVDKYDLVTDSTEEIVCFSSERLDALVAVGD